jgi:hypothetical protein
VDSFDRDGGSAVEGLSRPRMEMINNQPPPKKRYNPKKAIKGNRTSGYWICESPRYFSLEQELLTVKQRRHW